MSNDQDQQHPLQKERILSRGDRKRAAQRARQQAKRKADSMPAVDAMDGPVKTRVVDAELVSPAPNGGLIGVLREGYLLRLIVRRQMARMYSASLLGLMWSYIQPAIRFTVYYFVFGVLLNFHKNVPNFAIHLFCGIVFVHYFSETFGGGTRSIWMNRALVKKMALPREIFPVSQAIVALIHTFPQLVLLVFFCLVSGWTTDLTGIVSGVLGLLIVVTFAVALALLFSAINVYYRDFQNIVGTINQFMHFMVPMMYPFSRVAGYADTHPVLYQLYMANPVCNAVILLQRFFWQGVNVANGQGDSKAAVFPPHMLERGVITLGACLVLLVVAQRIFTRLENKLPERL